MPCGQWRPFYSSFHTIDRDQLSIDVRPVTDSLDESAAHFTRQSDVVRWITSCAYNPWNMQVDRPYIHESSRGLEICVVHVVLTYITGQNYSLSM